MALDKKTTDAVYALHKGLGVRDSKLSKLVLTTDLAPHWGITSADTSITLRAKVIYRMGQVFRTWLPPDVLVAPVIYNTSTDPELHDALLNQRVAALPHRFPTLRVAPRTADRIARRLREQVMNSVTAAAEPFDERKLAAILRQEEEFVVELERLRGSSAFERLIRGGYTAPMRGAHQAFLTQPLVTPLSRTNGLVIARTPVGDWVCTFSSVSALRAHQATTQQDTGAAVATLSGAELVRDLLARPQPVGVVVNPTVSRSDDARSTLRLAPADLADLADQL